VNIYTRMEHIDELFKTLKVYCKAELSKFVSV
jgi:hypothetical protein